MQEKRCPKCGKTKPTSEFHKNRSQKDGLNCWCAECRLESRERTACTKIVLEKRCPKCGEVKHHNEFYRNRSQKDGLTCYCKTCSNKRTTKRAHDSRAKKVAEYDAFIREVCEDPELKMMLNGFV